MPYILVLPDVYGDEAMSVRTARGLITARGGSTSHAAMVASNAEVPCVITSGDRFTEGDWLSIDGSSGRIFAGQLDVVENVHPELAQMLRKADRDRRLEIRANADTPDEACRALDLGAASIGLVRTEHMFFGEERLSALRALILNKEGPERIEDAQRQDFSTWFKAVGHVPITFRLLDAPLHEFLPQDAKRPVDSLMGIRGLRLTAIRPEIEAAQVRALVGAWSEVKPKAPLHILFPMVTAAETEAAVKRVKAITKDLPVEFGATIETPGAALEAGRIAACVNSIAWGTNDLTQFTLGIGRDIAPLLLPVLRTAGIHRNPLDKLDPLGAAQLVRIGTERARAANPLLNTGICGKHATDPDSVLIAHRLGLDYISVPAGQVPHARLAAGAAARA